MRHFDTWVVRDPYSIWHYYPSDKRCIWQETIQTLIQERKICSPNQNTSNININRKQPVNPQSLSPLITNLPPEIRQMIWTYVFGSNTIHLVTIKNKVRHVICPQDNPFLTQHRHCCPLTPARWRIYDGRIPGHSDRLLYPHTHDLLPQNLSTSHPELLRSCQAIYAESAELLYRNATFDVDDLHTFIAFAQGIGKRHLASIRRLTVQWMPVWQPLSGRDHKGSLYAYTHSDALWIQFWGIVATQLPYLAELKLSLDLGRFVSGGGVVVAAGGQEGIPLGITASWLSPLWKIRGLKDFELAVTARCDIAAKGAIEEDLVKEAGMLRDHLRLIMCSPVGVSLEEIGLGLKDLEILEMKPTRRQLAITA
ncbi:hypothetical protein N7520_003417 [Penicillium odoratum]|uniref:uncharacterized protein n=1 Tax=Penicillium odoratum TaxID=1167516 RepID=UPI00254828B2|nr:uncharacterized protein N7520_003417 [Penicillium odoratum]KAJ5768858.1 hypothetical protein N7520_003417 [Penicillium odoratum]